MADSDDPVDFAELARRADRMQDEMADVQADMAAVQATGYGGGGLVKATVSGEGRLIGLSVDPSVIDPNDPETLCELVIAAVESANQSMTEQRRKRMTEVTAGIGGLIDSLTRNQNRSGGVVPIFPSRRPSGRPGQPPYAPGDGGR